LKLRDYAEISRATENDMPSAVSIVSDPGTESEEELELDLDSPHSILCTSCLKASAGFLDLSNTVYPESHQATWSCLKDAAEAECQICSIIRKYYTTYLEVNYKINKPFTDSGIFTSLKRMVKESEITLGFPIKFTVRFLIHIRLEPSSAFPPQHPFIDVILQGADTIDSTEMNIKEQFTTKHVPEKGLLSAASLNLLYLWITNCLDSHQQCRQIERSSFKHTRLLDLGVELASDMQDIRIVVSEEHFSVSIEEDDTENYGHPGIRHGYMTLSHCWGGARNIKLLENNMEDFENGISMTDLPKTFAEAVLVVRMLGCRYLWIDSLCIVQDSPADWERESAIMGSVYKHAVLNVAASGVSDSSEGLFIQRNRGLVTLARLEASLQSSKMFYYVTENDYNWVDQFENAPLSRRAWVLQERLLAPRAVHFGKL
jgi:hypothetical protein